MSKLHRPALRARDGPPSLQNVEAAKSLVESSRRADKNNPFGSLAHWNCREHLPGADIDCGYRVGFRVGHKQSFAVRTECEPVWKLAHIYLCEPFQIRD